MRRKTSARINSFHTSIFLLHLGNIKWFFFRFSDSPSDSESALADAEEGLGGRGFGVGGDILFLPINSTYVPGKSPFSCPGTDAQIREDGESGLVSLIKVIIGS